MPPTCGNSLCWTRSTTKTRRRTGPQGAFFHLTSEIVSPPEEVIGVHFLLHFGIWVPGGARERLLEPPGVSWGASWALLRGSWESLGASCVLLGELLERIGALFLGDLILIFLGIDFCTEKVAQMEAFWKPK